jgi:hypothetical protein
MLQNSLSQFARFFLQVFQPRRESHFESVGMLAQKGLKLLNS